MFRMAAIVANPQKPVRKPPALEGIPELLLDAPWQFSALLRQMDREPEEGPFRAVAPVASRRDTQTAIPDSWLRQFDRILASSALMSD